MELAAAQHSDSAGAVLMQDDAKQPAQEIITVCTCAPRGKTQPRPLLFAHLLAIGLPFARRGPGLIRNCASTTLRRSESPVGTISAQAGGSAILPTNCVKREFRITEVCNSGRGMQPRLHACVASSDSGSGGHCDALDCSLRLVRFSLAR